MESEVSQQSNLRKARSRYLRATPTQVFSDRSKIPPQSLDMEAAILGALMLENDALTNTIDSVKPEFFYKPENKIIFEAIYKLFTEGQPVDILTVTEKLKEQGRLSEAGGAYYISQLTARIASTANIEYYARIVAQNYIKRRLIQISSDITRNAYDETVDALEVLDAAEGDLLSIGEESFQNDYMDMKMLVQLSIKEVESARSAKDSGISANAVPSGFAELDRLTNGWQKSTLIILAARPAMGKTAFALSMARNIAVEQQKAVAFFSLEMSAIEVGIRLISGETGLNSQKLKTGNLRDDEWVQLSAKTDALSKAPIFIDDTAALNMFELRAKCRRLKQKHDIKIIFLDYLQLMQGSHEQHGNREQEISKISRQLKALAKELKIPVIAMSQLSRSVETRGNSKIPQLSDLRESGAIEQDADIVMFIHRPEYYGNKEDERGSTVGIADILLEKHRSGPTGKARLRFISEYAKFANLDFSDTPVGTISSNENINPNTNFEGQPSSYVTYESGINNDHTSNNDSNISEVGGQEPPF